jgi:hypothetical protein
MKWKKLGRVFNPNNQKILGEFTTFAQAPQVLEFEDFVRVYFSTRKKDNENKFLSHVAFVDMTKDFSTIIKVSQNQVIALGGLGCFDEHGIFPFNVLKVQDKIYAYTCGWSRRTSVSVETATGLAFSKDDGVSFEKLGSGPILSANLNEPFLVGDSFVTYDNGLFDMWYIFGTKWIQVDEQSKPERVYKIGYANSTDGINWQRNGQPIIKDVLNEYECQALPTVVFFKNKYHMVFCYRFATSFRTDIKRGYRLGYAYSYNKTDWIRNDEHLGFALTYNNDWDGNMNCYPHFCIINNKLHLLYNGNSFGKDGFGVAILDME